MRQQRGLKTGRPNQRLPFLMLLGLFVSLAFLSRQMRPKEVPPYSEVLLPEPSSVPSKIPRKPKIRSSVQSGEAPAFSGAPEPSRFYARSYREKPEGNRIEFKIVDGYAVAYGDILLGKPEDPIPGGRGHYDAPQPRHWDAPEIPYAIQPDLPHPERIEKAITYLRENTPVRFVPYQGQKDAILFEVGSKHCLSLLGKVGGVQPIKLSSECRWQQVLHEILHALGFVHEQSRADRDQFIEILWDNIEEEYQDQFAQVPDSFLEPIRAFPFDYRSIMLYHSDAFARQSGLTTMRPRGAEPIQPSSEGLSEGDLKRLNRMFRGWE